MARKFYLSLVYDADGYDRFDILSNDSLQELDAEISKFKNRNEVINHYLSEYNIDKNKGRVCVVYEDTSLKKKQLDEYKSLPSEYQKDFKKTFSYAHIIPILYNKKRLLNIDQCLIVLKYKLREKSVIDSIMLNHRSEKGTVLKTNKKYLFETEEEQDLICNLGKYREAIECFLKRINNASSLDKYFYCRSLIDVCDLGITKVRTRVGDVNIRDDNMNRFNKRNVKFVDPMTESDYLEEDSKDMESFYIYHDLDEVIRLSPDKEKPIGSVGKRSK